MNTYLCVYLGSTLLALLGTPVVIWLARRIGAVDHPCARSVHQRPIPRIGGVAIFVSSMCLILPVLYLHNDIGEAFRDVRLQVTVLLGSATFIFLLGLVDDLRHLPARLKFLAYLQRRFRFDAWHLHYAYPTGSALPPLQRAGLEPVLTCHGIDVQTLPSIHYGARLDPEIDREVTRVLRRCKKLVAIGSDMHREFLDAGCEAARVFDIPNGVSLEQMNSIARAAAARKIRAQYRIPPTTPIILTVGRNHPKKGYDLIPAMIASLARGAGPFVWLIVGRHCESIAEALAARGLAAHARIVGSLGPGEKSGTRVFLFPSPETAEMFRAADLFAFPTKLEAMGLVVLEAMAAGLPVVTTCVPGVRDLVESGVNGYLAREGDAEDMARYLRTFLLDPHLRQEMGAKGLQKAQEYDWTKVAQRYLALYSRPCS